MIAQVRGTIVEKHPTRVIVDVGGLGYEVWISLASYDRIGRAGDQATLHTYLHVREDALQLFGFVLPEEKELFLLLISVSGIGPKSALGILSSLSSADLRHAIATENVDFLTSAPGVGKKTAQRMVVELKDKVSKVGSTEATIPAQIGEFSHRWADEATGALISLGFAKAAAEKAVAKAVRENSDRDVTVEELIKSALRFATSG